MASILWVTLLLTILFQFWSLNVVTGDSDTINSIIHQQMTIDRGEEGFYVIDVEKAIDRVRMWKKYFPRVDSHYAIKANPNLFLVELYAAYGTGFDCASRVSSHKCLTIDPKN